MTNERTYALCCDALRAAAALMDQPADTLLKMYEAQPEACERSAHFPILAILAPIMNDARAGMDKANGSGQQLNACKRIAKAASREDLRGAWTDTAGRFCVCSGFHAARLHGVKYDSIPAVKGMESLDQAMKRPASGLYEIVPPTAAECKAFQAMHGKKKPMPIDEGRRYVNPGYMLDMLQALPGAKVYATEKALAPVWFESEQGDGILMPHHPPQQ